MNHPERPARDLHPGAWWIWALGMAVATSRTTNPLLLTLIVAVVALVVAARRSDAAWANGFRAYLTLGAVIVTFRVVFRMLLDGQYGEHVLFTLPELPLPDVAAGIRLGGPVSAEGLLAAAFDGMRLATMIICMGAANALANPKRLLKAVPGALYEMGTAVTVALSVAPQLIESTVRINRARRLRGDTGHRFHWFRQVAVPVMTDALDRSLSLAAAMDSRGYGRTSGADRAARRLTSTLVLVGLLGVCLGTYGLLDATTPRLLGGPVMVVGLLCALAGFTPGGKRVRRTRYRPDPWEAAEWLVAGTGIAVAALVYLAPTLDGRSLAPQLEPLSWPQLPPLAALAVLVGAAAAVVSPPPVRATAEASVTPEVAR